MDFRERVKQAIAGVLGLDLTHCQVHYGRLLNSKVRAGIKWLEVGCGRQLIPEYAMSLEQQRDLSRRASLLVGVDLDEALVDHALLDARAYAEADHLPFPDEFFDLVTANMVVEHLREPAAALAEVFRVLRPGGCFVFHTPNHLYYLVFIASFTPERLKKWVVWILERRREGDQFKTYYRLNTKHAISILARAIGYEVELLSVIGSNGSFGRLAPIGWFECLLLKWLEVVKGGDLRSNLIASLRRPERIQDAEPEGKPSAG